MREAVATYCHDYDACWRPVEIPDAFPFVSTEAAFGWIALFVVCVVLFVRRLGRG